MNDVKLFQVKTTMLSCTDVQFKGLKIPTAHRKYAGLPVSLWCNYNV